MRSAVVASALVFFACASHRGAQAPVALPEVTIVQTAGVAEAARNGTGPIVVRYGIRVANKANVPVTLERVELQSVGDGAYVLPSTEKPFNVTISPDGHEDIAISAGAFVTQNTIAGANGPVTLRMILHYDSPAGAFRQVLVRQVNDRLTGRIPQ